MNSVLRPVGRLAIVYGGMAAVFAMTSSAGWHLLAVIIGTVFVMVADRRLPIETWMDERGVPAREIWPPLLALGLAWRAGLVEIDRAIVVVGETAPIILFIIAFSVAAAGLGRSGFFWFAANRVASKGNGNTHRLLLYLFALTSAITLVTSNDVVVLALTPIIIGVVVVSGLRNATLFLLAQFVAANTISMGMYIGSPTNIIVSQALRLNFVEYFVLMLIPTAAAFIATFVFVDRVNLAAVASVGRRGPFRRRLASWAFEPTYVPSRLHHGRFTEDMRRWVANFAVAVVWLALVSCLDLSLYWAGVPTLLSSLALGAVSASPDGRSRTRESLDLLRAIPVGIVFFGLSFFVITDAFARLPLFAAAVDAVSGGASLSDPLLSLKAILASGVSVNVFNDLPGTALLAELVNTATFENPLAELITLQGILVGVNIGTYVTPVGALAGIIWFSVIRYERRRLGSQADGLITPRRSDLMIYGLVMFTGVALVSGMATFTSNVIIDRLLTPPGEQALISLDATGRAVLGMSVCTGLFVCWEFRRSLRRSGVVLSHMKEVFTVATRLRLVALRHETLYKSAVSMSFVASMAMVIFWSENLSTRWRGRPPMFDHLGEYVVWFLVFVGSGFEQQRFPDSLLARVLTGMLPLVFLGVLVYLMRLPSGGLQRRMSERLAHGEIPSRRYVFVGYDSHHERIVRMLASEPQAFVLLFTRPAMTTAAERLVGEFGADRIFTAEIVSSTASLPSDYRLAQADLVVFGAGSVEAELDHVRAALELDRWARREAMSRQGQAVGGGKGSVPADPVEWAHPGPLVLFEASSARVRTRLSRARLTAIGESFVPIDLHADLASYLVADALCDLERLSRYYRLLPDADGFSGGFTHTGVRGAPAYFTRHTERDASENETFGLVARIGGECVAFGNGDFERARQHTVERWPISVMAANGEVAPPPHDCCPGPRVVVVNTNPRAEAFVDRLLSEGNPAHVLVLEDAAARSDLLRARAAAELRLRLDSVAGPQEAARRLFEPAAHTPVLAGTKLYVFLSDTESAIAEEWSTAFLQEFDLLLAEQGLEQDDFYVALESRSGAARFLHTELFVDKVFDPGVSERSYYEALGYLLRRELASGGQVLAGSRMVGLHQAAAAVQAFEVLTAADAVVEGDNDGVVELAGMELDAAVRVMRTGPVPRHMIGRLRAQRSADGSDEHLVPVLAEEPVKGDELLLMIPFI